MRRNRLAFGIAALLSVATLLGMSTPALAFQVMATSGPIGDYGWLPADDPASPGARCGYSGVLADSYAHLRWISVRPPRAVARDVTGGRDQQPISWQVMVQRMRDGGAWKTVASSAKQTRTGYDDQSASFSPIKVYYKKSANAAFRAIVQLKWWRNGSVEAWAKVRIEFYGVKWTVGVPDYVFTDACTGLAD